MLVTDEQGNYFIMHQSLEYNCCRNGAEDSFELLDMFTGANVLKLLREMWCWVWRPLWTKASVSLSTRLPLENLEYQQRLTICPVPSWFWSSRAFPPPSSELWVMTSDWQRARLVHGRLVFKLKKFLVNLQYFIGLFQNCKRWHRG